LIALKTTLKKFPVGAVNCGRDVLYYFSIIGVYAQALNGMQGQAAVEVGKGFAYLFFFGY